MAFQASSRCIDLDGSILTAECRDNNGKWQQSTLDLNDYIGNDDGHFSMYGRKFYDSAEFGSVKLTRQVVLSARLPRVCGEFYPFQTRTLNLNLVVANKNGRLKFQLPSEVLLSSGSCFTLDGSILKAVCLGPQGKFAVSTIDLDSYYKQFNTSKPCCNTACQGRIRSSDNSLILRAKLRSEVPNVWTSTWTQVDLANYILIRRGSMVFEKHDGLLDRDGFFAKFLEPIPFVGFIVATIHAMADDKANAIRALDLCASSSTVCGAIVIGRTLGGIVGACIGAGITTLLAILSERRIASLEPESDEAVIGRYIYETLRNLMAVEVAAYVGKYLKSVFSEDYMERGLPDVVAGLKIPYDAGKLSSAAAYALVRRLADALISDRLPPEWQESCSRCT